MMTGALIFPSHPAVEVTWVLAGMVREMLASEFGFITSSPLSPVMLAVCFPSFVTVVVISTDPTTSFGVSMDVATLLTFVEIVVSEVVVVTIFGVGVLTGVVVVCGVVVEVFGVDVFVVVVVVVVVDDVLPPPPPPPTALQLLLAREYPVSHVIAQV